MGKIPGAKNTGHYTYLMCDVGEAFTRSIVYPVPHKHEEKARRALQGRGTVTVLSGYEEACKQTSRKPVGGIAIWAMSVEQRYTTDRASWDDAVGVAALLYE